MPLVSILVPVYNVEKYIERCLRSLVEQTYRSIEIVIVNDGSTDQSQRLCENMARDYSMIHIHNYANAGVSVTRNRALSHAHGDYIMFVDSDDFIEPNCVEDMLAYMENNDCNIVACGYSIDLGWTQIYRRAGKKGVYSNIEALHSLANGTGINNYPWGKLFKKECFHDLVFPQNKDRFEDAYTIFKALIKADRIGNLPNRYYHYVQRAGSLTNHMNLESVYEMRDSVEYQDSYLRRTFPDEKFSFDMQYYNADMVILYTMIFHYNKKDHVRYRPADIDWSKISMIYRLGYYAWKGIAQLKVGSFQTKPQEDWK